MSAPAASDSSDPRSHDDRSTLRGTEHVDFGRRVVRVSGPIVSFRIDLRFLIVSASIMVGIGVLATTAMVLGDVRLSVFSVLGTFVGEGDKFERTVVLEWRLPRVVSAIVLGAALGVAGAIFQGFTKNPLGSPDIIGFTQGSYTGGVAAILLWGASSYVTAAGAVGGGLLTAVLVYAVAWRGGIDGFRLILVGVGVSAMLAAFSTYLIMSAELDEAMTAAAWGVGSLNGVTWVMAGPTVALAASCLILTLPLLHAFAHLELGHDRAVSLGLRLEAMQAVLVVVGVVLVAATTAVAGPITFVALVAPQIGKRLVQANGMSLPAAGCVGALVLLACDIVAQHAFATALPVGVVTLTVGGGYLVWLLVAQTRRRLV